MNKGFDYQDIHRAVMDTSALKRVPMINALDNQTVIDRLIEQGLSLSRERDLEADEIHLKKGDTVYVPVTEAHLLRQYEKEGGWPKKRRLLLARYTFVKGNEAEAKADSDSLYPWQSHHKPDPNRPIPRNSRIRNLVESDEYASLPVLTPEKVYFTADTHFSDERILRHRPGFTGVSQMDEHLIRRWNETVPGDGIVFHLGDLMTGSVEKVMELVNRLNGTILLIKGNHDDQALYHSQLIRTRTRLIMVGKERIIVLNGHKIFMNHYPFLCYAGQYGGVWQLFGHVHSGRQTEGFDLPKLANLLPYQYDVGVDNNDDAPIAFTRLEEIMARRDPYYFMNIRKATEDDAETLLRIAAEALSVMQEHGNTDEWDDGTFSVDILKEDMVRQAGFVVTERDDVIGYYALSATKCPPGSESLPWIEPEKPFEMIERVVRAREKHGILHLVTGHCFSRFDNIRLVTSRKNVPMLRSARKERFEWVGEYTSPDGTAMVGLQRIIQK